MRQLCAERLDETAQNGEPGVRRHLDIFTAEQATQYLRLDEMHRLSFDAILGTLADDGVLLYETFAAGNEAFGRPTNPDFLLAAGELLERVRGRLAVVAFEEGIVTRTGGQAVVQRLAAVGLRHARPWPLP